MSSVIATAVTCVTPSDELPIDTDYARRHLRGIGTAEDELIEGWIRAAQQYFEEQTGRPILQSVYEYWLDSFPIESVIELPQPPLVSVSSVTYAASDGTFSEWVDGSPSTPLYTVMAPAGIYARRGWVAPLAGGLWPTAGLTVPGAVRIRFTAGIADAPENVPDVVKAALLMLVGSFDQFRSEQHFSEGARVEEVPFGAAQIIDGFKKTAYATQVPHRL